MAGSRLARIGTIFARTNGMLQKNVLSVEEKPVWFDVYALHPPFEEPRYDRIPENVVVRDIFYEEDIIRAKFHSLEPRLGMVDLNDNKKKSKTQTFIQIYDELKKQGPLDDEKIIEVALDKVRSLEKHFDSKQFPVEDKFQMPQQKDLQMPQQAVENEQPKQSQKKKLGKGIDVKNLF